MDPDSINPDLDPAFQVNPDPGCSLTPAHTVTSAGY